MKDRPPSLRKLEGEVLKIIQERHERIRQNKLHRKISRVVWNGMKRAKDWLSEDRKEQIRKEMAYIAFEGLMRQREMNEQEAITGQLELNYNRI